MKPLIACLLLCSSAWAVEYPIVYVRAPRPADRRGRIPEVFRPVVAEPGTDLVRLNQDGSETVLVDAGDNGAVLDGCPSLDAQWVFYSLIPDAREGTFDGADLWKINVATGQRVRLTDQEWNPNRGAVPNWSSNPKLPDEPGQEFLGNGLYNLGACPLPGSRLAFVCSRNGYAPNKAATFPNLQLFLMDDDGQNVEQTGFLNLGSALHPVLLRDGRIMWSSMENQGHRHAIAWSLWASWPDGRNWEPLIFSAKGGGSPSAWHWQAQWPDGDIACTEYYANNNSGFGELLGFPSSYSIGTSAFGHPKDSLNPPVTAKYRHFYPFQRKGIWSATKWSLADDLPSPSGKVSMPSAAPGNAMLVCYSPGPAHHGAGLSTPHIQSEIRLLVGKSAETPADLVLIKSDPAYNYLQPKALVPWEQIYGSLPPEIPECPDSTHPLLPKGSPFGLVGTSSFYARETFAANDSNWGNQGSNATVNGVEFDSALIDRVRILVQEPTSQTRGLRNFAATGNERFRSLGEVPLRKPGAVDSAGDPDTSFLARIPADTSFTFQLLAQDGTALTTAQTWHQVRPGEIRHDCRGCHAHHEPGIEFAGTAAGKPGYQIADLTGNAPWTAEYFRDVLPIFQARCQECHLGQNEPRLDELFRESPLTLSGVAYAIGYSARTSTLYTKMKAGHGGATAEEALKVAQWIDLGCQNQELAAPRPNGVFADDHKPTLFLQSPRRRHLGPLDALRFGAFDVSGLGPISVKASFPVNGKPAGAELSDLFVSSDSVHTLPLQAPYLGAGEVTVSVKDATGNEQRIVRSFLAAGEAPPTDCEAEIARLTEEVARLTLELASERASRLAAEARIQAAKAALGD